MTRAPLENSIERAARADPRAACALMDPAVYKWVQDWCAYTEWTMGRGVPVFSAQDALDYLFGKDVPGADFAASLNTRGLELKERRKLLAGCIERPPEAEKPLWSSDPRLFDVWHWHSYQIRHEGEAYRLYECARKDPLVASCGSFEAASRTAARDLKGAIA